MAVCAPAGPRALRLVPVSSPQPGRFWALVAPTIGPMPGPAPKSPDQRARRNKDAVPWQTLQLVAMAQPELPDDMEWHPRTVSWWELWAKSPQAKYFGPTDWEALIDTARVHDAYWRSSGKAMLDYAAELRLRLGLFGAAPADRARLRIQFATAEDLESKADAKKAKVASARDRRGGLRPLDGVTEDEVG